MCTSMHSYLTPFNLLLAIGDAGIAGFKRKQGDQSNPLNLLSRCVIEAAVAEGQPSSQFVFNSESNCVLTE